MAAAGPGAVAAAADVRVALPVTISRLAASPSPQSELYLRVRVLSPSCPEFSDFKFSHESAGPVAVSLSFV